MRVISGKYKNIEIPFVNLKFDDANTTPQKIKKALFSIIGEDLDGKSFLDLYACSGQVGLEALSRGAQSVVFNEIIKERFHFIREMIKKVNAGDKAFLLNFHAFRCLRYLESKGLTFDCVFLDPPYPDIKNNAADAYLRILDEVGKYHVLKKDGKIIVQHLSRMNFKNYDGSFRYAGTRKYAKNSLSIFEAGE